MGGKAWTLAHYFIFWICFLATAPPCDNKAAQSEKRYRDDSLPTAAPQERCLDFAACITNQQPDKENHMGCTPWKAQDGFL